jgi:hypothetical protein
VFLDPWLRALEKAPFYFAGLVILILIVRALGRSQAAKLHDRMRALWDAALAGKEPEGSRTSGFMRLRNSLPYQLGFQTLKWRILPNLVGPALILLLLWLSIVSLTQIALLRQERGACQRSAGLQFVLEEKTAGFETRKTCNPTGFGVLEKHRYRVTVTRGTMWQDGGIMAGPEGSSSGNYRWYVRYLGPPLRRVVTARWMQLLYEVRPPQDGGKAVAEVHINPLQFKQTGPDTFEAEFVSPAHGELFFFVNDASTFWDLGYFYRNNIGDARISVTMALPQTPSATPVG